MTDKSITPELIHKLEQAGVQDVRTDFTTRLLYSTDASIYQVEPLGVVFPRRLDELPAIVEACAEFGVPLLARGSGSSLAGQAIGRALIVDCSRHLNRLIEIDPERMTATVEPGLVLSSLNRMAGRHGLQFGPDPASAERATLGGSIANNASGAHSIQYGMVADHLLSAEVVLSDGSPATFEEITLEEARRKAEARSIESAIYAAALEIRSIHAATIRQRWPRTWRRASGYSLNYLLPWAATAPPEWERANEKWRMANEKWRLVNGAPAVPDWPSPIPELPLPYPPVTAGCINLATLLAGSEGTLAVIRRATLRMAPLPKHTILGVLPFPGVAEACDAVPGILEYGPSAVELIPQDLIRLARSVPAYARQLSFVTQLGPGNGDPAALLVVEFSGDDPGFLREQVRALGPRALLAETAALQRQVWGVRKVGLGILMSLPGDAKPWSFVEDLAVPVERLGEFVREMERIMAAHGTRANFYAHASAGCLHIRPLLSLKTPEGVRAMREIAVESVRLTIRLGGSVSGEHGDGLARTEWLEQMYGTEVLDLFRKLKGAADPQGNLNPGKIVPEGSEGPPAMDARLRFGPDYQAEAWSPALDFSRQDGILGAVEMCNGAGVCRKAEGVMCPSFQATQDEMHSTRGRANLLRAMFSGRFPAQDLAEKKVYEALDLCLACKGCKAECPSAVDMAKLKYEFLNHYYRSHRRKLRDYLFGFVGPLAKLGHPFAPLVNLALHNRPAARAAEWLVGLARERPIPRMAPRSLQDQVRRLPRPGSANTGAVENVLLLSDAFTEFFYPEAGLAAYRVLEAAGCSVRILPVLGAGRTLISKAFLEPARRHTRELVKAIYRLDPMGEMPVIGVEPSEIYTLLDEYPDLFPGDEQVRALAERAFTVEEFLVRPGPDGRPDGRPGGQKRIERIVERATGEHLQVPDRPSRGKVLLHGHCYQKARPPAADGFPSGVGASVAMLAAAGYQVTVIDAGCCGMAGAFGHEAEHYDLSLKVGELALFPAVRGADSETIIAAAGISCQTQIEDGTGREALHPVVLLERVYRYRST